MTLLLGDAKVEATLLHLICKQLQVYFHQHIEVIYSSLGKAM